GTLVGLKMEHDDDVPQLRAVVLQAASELPEMVADPNGWIDPPADLVVVPIEPTVGVRSDRRRDQEGRAVEIGPASSRRRIRLACAARLDDKDHQDCRPDVA